MTTTIRPGYADQQLMRREQFSDGPAPRLTCHECNTPVGATEDGFDEFWIDRTGRSDAVWCEICIDPEEGV